MTRPTAAPARPSAAQLVETLQLTRHPEGGWYRQTYQATTTLPKSALHNRYGGARSASTAIMFLLESGDFSALHTIASDELWHFYLGDPLTVVQLDEHAVRKDIALGQDVLGGQQLQACVPHGALFGAYVQPPGAWSLVGCTVAPGFDFDDFVMPKRATLLKRYPQHTDLVEQLTRK